MINRNRLLMIVGVIALIALGVFLFHRRSKESYANIGDMTNIGSIDGYQLVEAPENAQSSQNFADIANAGNLSDSESQRMARIESGKLLPRISTPHNIDLADPVVHRYMANGPRVVTALKSRYKDYSLRSFIAGDIPIKYHPDVCLVDKTHLTRDDLRYDAVFTPHGESLYRNYSLGYKNMPQMVAGVGVGGQSGIIMDSY